jgi:tetratricopeptide (TPR) repeat protein
MTTLLKCKICGGDIGNIDKDVAECLYCGTKQILPKMGSDKKINLYDRADHYRNQNDFDKAAALYEQVLAEDSSDAEIYWNLVLCRYGVEYVEDPRTKKRIPTVNRTQFQSVFEDQNYKLAVENASEAQKSILEADAELIDNIQKGILDISRKEQPYDVFICYKETDDSGRRTEDSVIAQDIYRELVKEGYKVFFSRISLEDKIGSAYEPYIFAALNSAKVMVAVGTTREYFNAVWVKNEWSRYIGMISSGEKKTLIPVYKGMDPYDLPEEFSHLQGQDMSKIGAMQDLVHGIEKLIKPNGVSSGASNNVIDTNALKKRIQLFLDNKDFKNANSYADKLLDLIPEDGDAHLLKFCSEVGIKDISELSEAKKSFDNVTSYQNVIRFSSSITKEQLETYLKKVKDLEAKRQKKTLKTIIASAIAVCLIAGAAYLIPNVVAPQVRLLSDYNDAKKQLANGEYDKAYNSFEALGDYKDSSDKKLEVRYKQALSCSEEGKYDEAIIILNSLGDYSDSKTLIQNIYAQKYQDQIDQVEELIASKEYVRASAILDALVSEENAPNQVAKLREKLLESEYEEAMTLYNSGDLSKAGTLFKSLLGYKDSEKYIKECSYNRIKASYDSEMFSSVVSIIINDDMYEYEDCSEMLKYACERIASTNIWSYDSRIRKHSKSDDNSSGFHVSIIENTSYDSLDEGTELKSSNKVDHYYHFIADGGTKEKKQVTYYVQMNKNVWFETVELTDGECIDLRIDGDNAAKGAFILLVDEDNDSIIASKSFYYQ